MDLTIRPSQVGGTVSAPPSKSYTHRGLLAAGYAPDGELSNPLVSADTKATARIVEAFGGTVTWDTETVTVTGFDGTPQVPDDILDCENSGTTMRLAAATAALASGTTVITGDVSLRERPHDPLLHAITELGGQARSTRDNGQAPIVIDGPIDGGSTTIPGDVSSQFVTALLFAGAVTTRGIDIQLATALRSKPYVDITQSVLDAFEVTTTETADGYQVPGEQAYSPPVDGYRIPGDFSSISYLAAAGAIAAPTGVTVTGVSPTPQGDTAILDHLDSMGATVEWDRTTGRLTVSTGSLSGITVSVADTPDLLPTLAVLGAVADGTTRITDCEHVRYKETDRVSVMADRLEQMGATVTEEPGELHIDGTDTTLTGADVDSGGDHRIVMALTIAALAADSPTTIADADSVSVSFPDFFEIMESLGAAITTTA